MEKPGERTEHGQHAVGIFARTVPQPRSRRFNRSYLEMCLRRSFHSCLSYFLANKDDQIFQEINKSDHSQYQSPGSYSYYE